MVCEYAKAFLVKMILMFVGDKDLQRLPSTSLPHYLTQVAVGRPLVPAPIERATGVEPWIDQ
jgi:hypothetical protein